MRSARGTAAARREATAGTGDEPQDLDPAAEDDQDDQGYDDPDAAEADAAGGDDADDDEAPEDEVPSPRPVRSGRPVKAAGAAADTKAADTKAADPDAPRRRVPGQTPDGAAVPQPRSKPDSPEKGGPAEQAKRPKDTDKTEKPARPPKEVKERPPRRTTVAVGRDIVSRVALVAQLVLLAFAAVVVIGLLLVVSDANLAGSAIVRFFVELSAGATGPFRDVFTANGDKVIDASGKAYTQMQRVRGVVGYSKKGVFENWGLAAAVYVLLGSLVRRFLGK